MSLLADRISGFIQSEKSNFYAIALLLSLALLWIISLVLKSIGLGKKFRGLGSTISFLKNVLICIVIMYFLCLALWREYLPGSESLYSIIVSDNIDLSNWIAVAGFIISSFSALISIFIAIKANNIANAQKRNEDFQFDELFNIEIDDKMDVLVEKTSEFIFQSDDSGKKKKKNYYSFLLQLYGSKRKRRNFQSIYRLQFSLAKYPNPQVIYCLNDVTIYNDKLCYIDTIKRGRHLSNSYNYKNVRGDIGGLNGRFQLEVLIQDSFEQLINKDQNPLYVLSHLKAYERSQGRVMTFFLEFIIYSNDNNKSIDGKRIGILLNVETKDYSSIMVTNTQFVSLS